MLGILHPPFDLPGSCNQLRAGDGGGWSWVTGGGGWSWVAGGGCGGGCGGDGSCGGGGGSSVDCEPDPEPVDCGTSAGERRCLLASVSVV